MKKILISLLVLFTLTVYLKQLACPTYKGWGKFDPPYKIELKSSYSIDNHGLHGESKDGTRVFIPWDSIAWMEEK